jgi:hypothetical protein
MRRRKHTATAPSDGTIAVMAAVSLILFAWGVGEFVRSI